MESDNLVLHNDTLTISQINNILNYTNNIIDNLDNEALLELCSGYEKDIDKLLGTIIQETDRVLHSNQNSVKSSSFNYLDKLSDSIEETLRRESFGYFLVNVLTDFNVNWHHLEWVSHVETFRLLSIIASRGIGKSRFFSYAYPLWKMYKYEKPLRFVKQKKSIKLCEYGILFTYEMDLGITLLSYVKDAIESNEILNAKLYPQTKDNWSAKSIETKNKATLEIKSYGSKARGRHPGYKVLDDFLIDNVLYNSDQNRKMIESFDSVISPMGRSIGASCIVVGTPFLSHDLYGELKKRKQYKVFEYPALLPDGTVLWPEQKSFQDIMNDKESMSSLSFSREILCKPITSDSTIFPYDMLAKCFSDKIVLLNNIYSSPIKFKRVVVGCDFAMSSSIGADNSVYITLGIDDNEDYWIINIQVYHGKTYNEQMVNLKKLNQDFKPDIFCFEDNGFQKIFYDGAVAANLPVIAHTTGANKYDLKEGLPSLALLFENRKIRIPRGDQNSIDKTDMMIGEATSITFTDKGLKSVLGHDDIMFALWKNIIGCRYRTNFGFSFI